MNIQEEGEIEEENLEEIKEPEHFQSNVFGSITFQEVHNNVVINMKGNSPAGEGANFQDYSQIHPSSQIF